MSEATLHRVLVRSRRRRPRPPWFYICLTMLTLLLAAACVSAIDGNGPFAAADALNAGIWWRALHSPPRYWDQRAFWTLWPTAMALAMIGAWT